MQNTPQDWTPFTRIRIYFWGKLTCTRHPFLSKGMLMPDKPHWAGGSTTPCLETLYALLQTTPIKLYISVKQISFALFAFRTGFEPHRSKTKKSNCNLFIWLGKGLGSVCFCYICCKQSLPDAAHAAGRRPCPHKCSSRALRLHCSGVRKGGAWLVCQVRQARPGLRYT